MNILQLNFSESKQLKQRRSNITVMVILAFILIGLVLEYNRIESEVSEIEYALAESTGQKTVRQAKPTEQDLRAMKAAKLVQNKLNFPWSALLSTLEKVKQHATTITIMTIQPNVAKNEVIISAESPNVKAMLAFVTLLEKQAVLNDVLLLNQRQVAPKLSEKVAFTLKMGWTT